MSVTKKLNRRLSLAQIGFVKFFSQFDVKEIEAVLERETPNVAEVMQRLKSHKDIVQQDDHRHWRVYAQDKRKKWWNGREYSDLNNLEKRIWAHQALADFANAVVFGYVAEVKR